MYLVHILELEFSFMCGIPLLLNFMSRNISKIHTLFFIFFYLTLLHFTSKVIFFQKINLQKHMLPVILSNSHHFRNKEHKLHLYAIKASILLGIFIINTCCGD